MIPLMTVITTNSSTSIILAIVSDIPAVKEIKTGNKIDPIIVKPVLLGPNRKKLIIISTMLAIKIKVAGVISITECKIVAIPLTPPITKSFLSRNTL